MKKCEKLYTDIPPTRLRNRKEKFRKAVDNPFWIWVADTVFRRMLTHRFYALRIKNKEAFDHRNKNYPVITFAPHGNWWDGIVGYNIMRQVMKCRTRMMIEEMNRFPLFSKIGAFPVNKKSAQEAVKSLKYCVEILSAPDLCFWIFPQGIIKPPNYRPIEFQTGLAYIAQNVAKKYGGINIFPAAVNYTFLREDRPEALVELGEPIIIDSQNSDFDRHQFTQKLQENFTIMCDKQIIDISKGEVTDYEYVYQQDLPWNRKIEKKLKNIAMKNTEIK